MERVIVVGGGLAGLTAAVALARKGVRVTVLEADDALGGRARSFIDPVMGDRVDIGPHVILKHYPSFRKLLAMLGTEAHVVWDETSGLAMAYGTDVVDTPILDLPPPLHCVGALARHPRARASDLLASVPAVLLALTAQDEDIVALDEIDALTLLRAIGVPEASLGAVWGFAAHSILNVPLERCSAGALVRLAGYFLSKRAPWFGFAGTPLADLFAGPAEAEVCAAGGEVHHEAPVRALVVERGRVSGAVLEDGREMRAELVIAAVPPRVLSTLLRPEWVRVHEELRGLSAFEPVPYASAYLWLDRKLGERRMWARPYDRAGLGSDFYDLSNIRSDIDPSCSLIAVNVIDPTRLPAMDDEAIVHGLVRELAETWPELAGARVRHASVHRIEQAVPAAAPGIERHRLPNATAVPGLYVAGDWTDTGLPFSMESAAESGFRAAEEALAALRGEQPRLVREVGPREGLAAGVAAIAQLLPTRPSAFALAAVRRG